MERAAFNFLICPANGPKGLPERPINRPEAADKLAKVFGLSFVSFGSSPLTIAVQPCKAGIIVVLIVCNCACGFINKSLKPLGILTPSTCLHLLLNKTKSVASSRAELKSSSFFDPSVGALVKAWGFRSENDETSVDSTKTAYLRQFIGFDKVKIVSGKVVKVNLETYLDFNAIAKGFAVDVVGRYLEKQLIDDYLVEIGGEIRARGVNAEGKPWRVGIEKPHFDGTRSLQTRILLNNESMATSGSYRKFRIDTKTGRKYSHTIDPKTGFPAKNSLLSVSVIAKTDCADVDAYATAFMAMGLEKVQVFLKEHQGLKVLLLYVDNEGSIKEFDNFR